MLIGHWEFNNSNIDSISNKSINIYSSSYTAGINGIGGVNASSVASGIEFSLSDFGISRLQDFSVSFWMKTSHPASSVGGGSFSNWFIHFGGYYNNNSAGFGLQSGNVAHYLKGSTSSGWSAAGSNATGTSIYNNNQNDWIHCVVVFRSNSRILFYMDGYKTFNSTIADGYTGTSTGIVTLGKNMNMYISGLRIYDNILSERDIDILRNEPLSLKENDEVNKQLALWYPFDDNSSSDRSGNKYNTSLPSSSPTWTNNSNIGRGAFIFDGSGTIDGTATGDYLDVVESATDIRTYSHGCTYSFWINVDTDAPDRMSLFYGASTIRHIEIYSIGKNFRTEAGRQNGYSFGSGNFPDNVRGVWSHFAIVFATDETNRPVRWYQNGQLFYTGNMDSGDYPGTEYFSFNKIARSTGTPTYKYAKSFKGKMSDFRIYGSKLSSAEIQNLSSGPTINIDDIKGIFWAYTSSSGTTTKLYDNGHLEYGPKFNKNIIEGL